MERPRLRALEVIPAEDKGKPSFYLRDPSGDSPTILVLSEFTLQVSALMDGTRDLGDLQADFYRAGGSMIPREVIRQLTEKLDEALFLDSPRYREEMRREGEEFLRAPERPATFAGSSYDADPGVLGPWIDSLVQGGSPEGSVGRLRALIAPHIDPTRGAKVYGSAYRAFRGSAEERIIILGISHRGGEVPFAALSKDYATPFGACPVDRDFLRRLRHGLPFDPEAGQGLHRKEHSIEFQAVFLRHLLSGWDRRSIVPILCCFPYLPPGGEAALPYPSAWIAAFIARLKELLDQQTSLVLGVDFAHIGRRFGDARGSIDRRAACEAEDRSMMEAICTGDAASFRESIDRVRDARRICGYPAILTLLEVCPGLRGEVLEYGQALEEAADSLVSFGAIAFR